MRVFLDEGVGVNSERTQMDGRPFRAIQRALHRAAELAAPCLPT